MLARMIKLLGALAAASLCACATAPAPGPAPHPPSAPALEVASRLSAARTQRGLPQVKLVTYLQAGLQDALAAVAHHEKLPPEALDELLEASQVRTGHSFRGWYREAARLEELVFPPEFFEGPELLLAIEVGFYRPPGEPKGRFAVFFVAQDESDEAPATR